MPLPFILGQSPLSSPVFVLGEGDGTLAIPGRDILVELSAWDIAGEAETTFYFGSRGYSDPTGPGYYRPRLSQPLNFRRDIYTAQTTGGASRTSFGEMRLVNNDGDLDYLAPAQGLYAIVGRRVRMLIGDISQPYSTFEALIVGQVKEVLADNAEVVIRLRDLLELFSGPLQTNKFDGGNVLPAGVEGSPDDIKDKQKPLTIGVVLNVTPPCVNTSKLIYQLNDGPIIHAILVADNGAFLSLGTDYTDQADMEANAPAAGWYRVWPAGGYFRLGADPVGTITCTAADQASGNSAAQVAVRIATRVPLSGEGGIDAGDIETDDVTALDTANSANVGIFPDGNATYQQALDAVLTSIGAWHGFDRVGKWRLQRLELPVLPYITTFRVPSLPDSPLAVNEYRILDYRFMPSNDPERGMPSYRVSVDYGHNYTVQQGDATAGTVLQSRRNFLALADRTVAAADFDVQAAYPQAYDKKVSTLLVDEDDGTTEAARLLEIFKEPRFFLEIDAVLTSDLIELVDMGSVVNVVLPRLGFADGKIMRVIGMQYNGQAGQVTLACWG